MVRGHDDSAASLPSSQPSSSSTTSSERVAIILIDVPGTADGHVGGDVLGHDGRVVGAGTGGLGWGRSDRAHQVGVAQIGS